MIDGMNNYSESHYTQVGGRNAIPTYCGEKSLSLLRWTWFKSQLFDRIGKTESYSNIVQHAPEGYYRNVSEMNDNLTKMHYRKFDILRIIYFISLQAFKRSLGNWSIRNYRSNVSLFDCFCFFRLWFCADWGCPNVPQYQTYLNLFQTIQMLNLKSFFYYQFGVSVKKHLN